MLEVSKQKGTARDRDRDSDEITDRNRLLDNPWQARSMVSTNRVTVSTVQSKLGK